MLTLLVDLVRPFGGAMTTPDAPFNRYDPWYVKVTFGLFVTLVVGFLAVLHGAPNYIVQ
jgi:hypothetical protein